MELRPALDSSAGTVAMAHMVVAAVAVAVLLRAQPKA
jgi:hypothetical protein